MGNDWANCFKTHNEPTMYPLGKCPLAPSAMWMKARSYMSDHIPFVSDVELYLKRWVAWWSLCQPTWHQGKGWPLPMDDPDATDWGIKAFARGQNGLFLIIVSTTWWASFIQSAKDWSTFDEAVEDIQWVIDQATIFLKPVLVPKASMRSTTPPELVPAPGATWMARESGKRRPKPSRRLLEGGGIGAH